MLPFDFVDLHIDWIRVCVFFCEVSISEAKQASQSGFRHTGTLAELGWELVPIQVNPTRA